MLKTLKDLDDMITKLKEVQVKTDSECNLHGDAFCGYCRYINGFWGDIKVNIEISNE